MKSRQLPEAVLIDDAAIEYLKPLMDQDTVQQYLGEFADCDDELIQIALHDVMMASLMNYMGMR